MVGTASVIPAGDEVVGESGPRPASQPRTIAGWLGLGVSAGATLASLARGPHGSQVPNMVLLAVAFAGFGVAIWAGRAPGGLSRRGVVVASVVLLAVAVAAPPIQSGDVWGYAAYGRMVSHYDDSPFTHPPAAYPDDPIISRTAPLWAGTASIYGPVWIALSAPGTWLAGDSPLANRLWFGMLAALSIAMAMWLVSRETQADPVAIALIGINPFVVISVVNGAHNDAVVGLAVLGAVLLAQRRRWGWCGLVLGLAVATKLPAAVCVLALGAWVWARFGREAVIRIAGVAVATVAVAYAVAGGPSALAPARRASRMLSGASPWRAVRYWALHPTAQATSQLWATAATVVVVVAALWVGWRHRDRTQPALAVGAVVLLYAFLAAYMLPWYLVWAVLPLALVWRSRTTIVVVGFAAVMNVGYVPDPRVDGKLYRDIPHTTMQHLQYTYVHSWLPVLEIVGALALLAWSTDWPSRWLAERRAATPAAGAEHRRAVRDLRGSGRL